MNNSPATNSLSSTSVETSPGNSLAVLEDGSPNGSTLSWTTGLRLHADPGSLSPKNRAVYELIVTELKAGMKPNELARSLGVAPSWVSDRLAELRNEILFASGEFPELPDDVFSALAESIKRDGVLVPIVVDEHGEVIDGRARRIVARRLGIHCPEEIHQGLTAEERRRLAITLNVARRHLSNNEKRMLVTAELMHDGDRSDRAIALVTGVDHKTVGKIREQLRADGVAFATAVVEPEDEEIVEAIDEEARVTVVGEAACPCCGVMLRVLKRAGVGLVLEEHNA